MGGQTLKFRQCGEGIRTISHCKPPNEIRVRWWLQLRIDFDSTAVRLPNDCNSTALRPFDHILYTIVQGRLQGGEWTQLASKLGSGGRKLHPEGGRIPQIYGSYVKCETLDSSRFKTKMRQNAPNPISIFFQGSPQDPRHWGLCPQTAGEGRGEEGEGGGEGTGGGSLRHCRWGIDAPAIVGLYLRPK